jgi:hypothetical protein
MHAIGFENFCRKIGTKVNEKHKNPFTADERGWNADRENKHSRGRLCHKCMDGMTKAKSQRPRANKGKISRELPRICANRRNREKHKTLSPQMNADGTQINNFQVWPTAKSQEPRAQDDAIIKVKKSIYDPTFDKYSSG